jgi:hypothetical protein
VDALPVAAAGVVDEDLAVVVGVAADAELGDEDVEQLPSEEQPGGQAQRAPVDDVPAAGLRAVGSASGALGVGLVVGLVDMPGSPVVVRLFAGRVWCARLRPRAGSGSSGNVAGDLVCDPGGVVADEPQEG